VIVGNYRNQTTTNY